MNRLELNNIIRKYQRAITYMRHVHNKLKKEWPGLDLLLVERGVHPFYEIGMSWGMSHTDKLTAVLKSVFKHFLFFSRPRQSGCDLEHLECYWDFCKIWSNPFKLEPWGHRDIFHLWGWRSRKEETVHTYCHPDFPHTKHSILWVISTIWIIFRFKFFHKDFKKNDFRVTNLIAN